MKQYNPPRKTKDLHTDGWYKLRTSKLMQSPLCEICPSKDIIIPMFHVHHIDSFISYKGMKYKEVAYNTNNLILIYEQCHQKVHN